MRLNRAAAASLLLLLLAGLLCGVSARNKADLEEDARLSMLAGGAR